MTTSEPHSKRDTIMRVISFVSGLIIYLFMSRVVFDHIEHGLLRVGLSMLASFALFIGITLTVLTAINARSSRK